MIGDYDYRNAKDLISEFSNDRQALVNKVGQSPHRQRLLTSEALEDDSRDSDETREAIRQAQKIKSGQVNTDPESRYLEKKRQAAQNLLEEKEKAIQKALASKMARLEQENADEMMKRALDLNVEEEANKRF